MQLLQTQAATMLEQNRLQKFFKSFSGRKGAKTYDTSALNFAVSDTGRLFLENLAPQRPAPRPLHPPTNTHHDTATHARHMQA